MSLLPKVSIIITTYNSAGTIQRTLDSITAQKYLNDQFSVEVLVVDDCSTDHTRDVVQHHRIGAAIYSTGTNSGGPNKGRNIGLSNVTGDYICIMDHDDIWAENKVVDQLRSIGSASIVFTNMKRSFHGKQPVVAAPHCFAEVEKHALNAVFRHVLMYGSNRFFYNTMMFRKSLCHHRFEEVHGMVDYDWFLRILQDQEVVRICAPLVTRFIEKENLSRSPKYRSIAHQYGMETLRKYQTSFPKEVSVGLRRLNASLARYHYMMGNMKEARKYLLRSQVTIKNTLYFLTTFGGSRIVRKYFDVF